MRRHRSGAWTLSVDRRGACGLADIAMGVWTPSTGECRCPRRLSRLAGISCLDPADARPAMDDTHHRAVKAASSLGGPLSIPVAPQLCRGCRRNRRAAAGSKPSAAGHRLYNPQHRGSCHPHTGRKSRAGRVVRHHDARQTMNGPVTGAKADAATWFGFVLMCLGMFMAILDIQVVATSLPAIQDALAISRDAMSWIQTAYLIAEIIAIPLTGWLTRVLTLRWLFVAAISLFTAASIGCALSDNFSTLISFRILQGFAGGALIPAVFSAVFLLFPLRLHPLATTLAGIVAVLAPTVGPIVGGWITETWSWHWLFLINVAPGLVAAAATPFLLPQDKTDFTEFRNLDVLSLLLLAIALATLEVGLKQAPQDGWLSPRPLALFAASLMSGWIFVSRTLKATHPV